MKKQKERTIWQNTDLNLEDWRQGLLEEAEERGEDIDELDDDELYNRMEELNNEYIDDERMNLSMNLGRKLKIIAIASLGFWNGRRSGYKIINGLENILYAKDGCDYCKWYFDGKDVKSEMRHHDGSHYITYRVIKDGVDIDKLCDKIYNNEEISSRTLGYYTRSLKKEMNEIYGW